MSPGSADIYSAVIPPQNSSQVKYYVEAYDYAGNRAVANNGGQFYIYGGFETILALIILAPVAVILLLIAIAFLQRERKLHEQETKTKMIGSSKQNWIGNHG